MFWQSGLLLATDGSNLILQLNYDPLAADLHNLHIVIQINPVNFTPASKFRFEFKLFILNQNFLLLIIPPMRIALCFILLLFFSLARSFPAQAQKEANNWLWGFRVGINFNSALPQPILHNNILGCCNTASISDGAGNLQFYFGSISSNMPVYNRNHQPMPNGFGYSSFGLYSLVIPWPGQSKYYLFTGHAPNFP
ncbi:MAG TPA: hypothetical protein VK927_08290, partial [Adhaeribacter sp.]|nr:hypothetical protein [Adhaeribacter sp.]